MTPSSVSRDFTVAIFVVDHDRVLLHFHEKLQRWLPPGGHIEPNELPDDAAVREVFEETGVACRLVGGSPLTLADPALPRQLVTPVGIQLERIGPGHEHIDLIYVARGSPASARPGVGWFRLDELAPLDLTEEVAAWCQFAVQTVADS